MKAFVYSAFVLAGLGLTGAANAASPFVGKEKAMAVCSQCHGLVNPAVGAPFPPLAGRDAQYLKTAIKQYRDKTRQSDLMNAIAGSLSDADIDNIVSYYSTLKP